MKKAFTLIELLFVMAIMAILSGFAIQSVSSLQSFKQKGDMQTAMWSSMNLAQKAMKRVSSSTFRDDFDSDGWRKFDQNGNYYIKVGGTTYRFSCDQKGSAIYLKSGCCSYIGGRCETGFYISIKNDNLNEKWTFNSCTQNQPSKVN